MTDSVPLQWCWAVNHSNSYSHEHTRKLETLKIKKKKGNTWYKMIKKNYANKSQMAAGTAAAARTAG